MFRNSIGICALLGLLCVADVSAQDAAADLEALKEQADDAYRQRNFPQAIKLSNEVLAKQPEDHVGLYLRGSSQVEFGILSGNSDMLRKGIADARDAIRLEAKGKPEYYLPYIYGMSHLADVEQKKAHAQTALTVADSVLEREDLTAEQRANLYYQHAQANMRLDNNAGVEADLNQAIKFAPEHLAAHMALAELAASTKTPNEALAAFSKVIEAFPTNPVAYNNRGMFLQTQNRPADAINDFTYAIKLDARFVPAYINRGFAYLEENDFVKAEAALSEVINIDPAQLGAISLRATARMNQNKATEALEDYKRVVQMAPENPMAHADLGFAQFFSGDFAGAYTSFSKALEIESEMRFILPWKLASAIRANTFQQQDYQAVLAKPTESRDWIDSLVLFQLGKIDVKALYAATHPDDQEAKRAQLCEAYYFIGMELLRQDRQKDAIAYWQQSIKMQTPRLSAYRGAAFALKNNGVEVK